MRFNAPFETLVPSLRDLYAEEIRLHESLIDAATAFLSGPRPNVDYGKLAAQIPQLRAALDEADQTLLEDITPLICFLLVDSKTGLTNKADHLLITEAQRAQLLETLNLRFGSRLQGRNQNFRVTSARVIKDFLSKNYKAADER
jgi:hypothetical protein